MSSVYTSFEATMAELARHCEDPRAGLFGPGSLSWEMGREAFVFLAGGRAALLQTAHPFVAHAVDQHSATKTDPLGRFHRTFEAVYGIIFGDLEFAMSQARKVFHIHDGIKGLIREDVGRFHRDDAYHALDVEALLWVHATLLDSALVTHEMIVGKLSYDHKSRYYEESKIFARLFGVPKDALPKDYAAFQAYYHDALDSNMIAVGEPAREMADFLFTSERRAARPVMRWYRTMTAGLLPKKVREGYRIKFGPKERLVYEASLSAIRLGAPLLPERLRYTPAYVEAMKRLQGLPAIDPAGRRVEQLILDFLQPSL